MNAGRLLRPVARTVRAVPGYSGLRRRAILRLRRSPRARRMARSIYPDLQDPRQVQKLITDQRNQERDRQREAQRDRQREAQRRAAKALAAAQREQNARIAELTRDYRRQLKAQRLEHKERLQRSRLNWERRAEQDRLRQPAVSTGELVGGLGLADRPLVLFDVREVSPDLAPTVLEEIAAEQLLGCGFRPMFLLEQTTDTQPWQRYGHLCEQLPGARGWAGKLTYPEYLGARMEALRVHYDVRWYLPVAATGLSDVQRAFLQRCGR